VGQVVYVTDAVRPFRYCKLPNAARADPMNSGTLMFGTANY
jgi:hypothetical protein